MVKGYRKMCRTGMEVGVLIKLDSGQLGHGSCQLRSTLSLCECVMLWVEAPLTNALFLALEGDCVVPWKFQYQFIMGNKLACVSSIQPNEKS